MFSTAFNPNSYGKICKILIDFGVNIVNIKTVSKKFYMDEAAKSRINWKERLCELLYRYKLLEFEFTTNSYSTGSLLFVLVETDAQNI